MVKVIKVINLPYMVMAATPDVTPLINVLNSLSMLISDVTSEVLLKGKGLL